MRILVVGSTGAIGAAATKALRHRGHQVFAAHRSAEHPVDITNDDSIRQLLDEVGRIDAVVCAAGTTPFGEWKDLDRALWGEGLKNKLLAQVCLVRAATASVRTGGSFTLTSGVLGREPIRGGSIAAAGRRPRGMGSCQCGRTMGAMADQHRQPDGSHRICREVRHRDAGLPIGARIRGRPRLCPIRRKHGDRADLHPLASGPDHHRARGWLVSLCGRFFAHRRPSSAAWLMANSSGLHW